MAEKIRVLICKTCQSVDELPWYEGPIEGDVWLNQVVNNHPKFGDGRPHIAGGLFNIDVQQHWNTADKRKNTLTELHKQLEIPGEGAGFGSEFYDLKSTYVEDAFACWKSFNRTTNPGHCDYRKENKKLLPDTAAARKELGKDPKERPNTYLCDFCPLQSIVDQKKRSKAGLYA